ncbi:hypothetical protein LB503_006909 [Fusarium chuoi]|nr:hypothetical protein LB503_006909 [Fusarium chuoi]
MRDCSAISRIQPRRISNALTTLTGTTIVIVAHGSRSRAAASTPLRTIGIINRRELNCHVATCIAASGAILLGIG